jgi:VWFA-related protein
MKLGLVIWLLCQFTVSAFASSRVTVDQLNHIVVSSQGKPDAKIADRLFGLELTERLSAAKLATLEAALPGSNSRRALVALADQSTFLDPPPAEIPNQPAPGLEQQRVMTAKAVDYVKTTLNLLPNLFARRDTIRFEDTPAVLQVGSLSAPSGTFIPSQPLHPISRSTETVLNRDGQEIVQSTDEGQVTSAPKTTGLTTFGEFGPILSAVLGDLPQGTLVWSHWEQGSVKAVAVFRFQVLMGASHYQVKFCCISGRVFDKFPAYHGEISIDPADGTILRLNLLSDLGKSDSITKANVMVEYGPIELGKQIYFCPIRSISVSVAPVESNRQKSLPVGLVLPTTSGQVSMQTRDDSASDAPLQTMLNEVVFDQYHLFHSEARILTPDDSATGSIPDGSANSASTPAMVSAANPIQLPTSANESPVSIASADTTVDSARDAHPVVPQGTARPPATEPSTELPSPEIAVVAPADLPITPAAAAVPSAQPEFSLRVNTRLVDIGVTAYEKSRPITDLTRDDFKVYDNGKKQNLRSFGYAAANSPSPLTSAAAGQPVLYSNHLLAMGGAQPEVASAPESSTIILFDATSLSFADFTYVRDQLLSFLNRIPSSEPVGVYVRAGFGFRVLSEVTTNHGALTSALRSWIPNAQDLARAQEEEMRNRQQFDTVESPADMQYVNGNIGGTAIVEYVLDIPGGGPDTTSDPKLMKEGFDPVSQALAAIAAVAAHMGVIPGHKNLIWIASDNVLANWTDQATSIDRGPDLIGRLAVRTQEVLNDAHASLYPFDASQLGTATIDPSLQNASVQLDLSVRDMYPPSTLGDAAPRPGARATAELRQDSHPVQAAIQQLANATGGQSFGRSSNVIANLDRVIEDGRAAYLLSFAPDTQPDDKYHQLTVAVPARRGITLRYRTGYLYVKEPATLKDRVRQTIWQPLDATEIGINARRFSASSGSAVSLSIVAADINMAQQGDRLTDKLDIILVQRDQTGMRAMLKQQTLALDLKPATYERVMRDGVPSDQYLDNKQGSGSVRIIVVDENSGRIGSITLPAATGSFNPEHNPH